MLSTLPADLLATFTAGLRSGQIIPYLGPGVLAGVVHRDSGKPIPADSDSLILAMNDGKPMSPKLMYEFSRAAMNVELKRGRQAVNKFLTRTYDDPAWSRSRTHDWLQTLQPAYVIDINRDPQLQDSYAATPHTLVVGVARIGGTDYRYKLFHWDGSAYSPVDILNLGQPVLFKPMGTPRPQPNYIASDADYVDFITELMGGFSIPAPLKAYRQGKQYLLLGLRLNRDTERMVLADMIYSAGQPAGWAVIASPTDKERRFCHKLGLQIIESELDPVLDALGAAPATTAPAAA